MEFKIVRLKKFLNSVQQNGVKHINIKSKQFELIVNTVPVKTTTAITHETSFVQAPIKSNPEKLTKSKIYNSKPDKKKVIKQETEIYSTIISPMVGTFYRSPAPNEAPFIETKDIVQANQTVCLIEAMKLMNEIEAEVNGEIVEILVEDGDIVDCGQALMKVKSLN